MTPDESMKESLREAIAMEESRRARLVERLAELQEEIAYIDAKIKLAWELIDGVDEP